MLSSRRGHETGALLEREQYLDAIRDALQSGREGQGRTLLVSGAPGIGKTRVLDAAVALARDAGHRVLRARGSESEQSFPFGGVLQLMERVVVQAQAEGQPLFGGSAALAHPVFEGHFLSGEAVPLASAIHGLFWLTVNLSAEEPLALVIDDLHALDDPTLAYLLYLHRRINDLPVTLIAASRPPEALRRPALSELALAPGVEEVQLAPLSPEAVAMLVRARFDADAEDAFCEACVRVSGGNPFYLEEALRELSAEGAAATREGARRLADVEPHAVGRAVLLRLARLSPEAGALARAAAILGMGASLTLAAELAELPVAAALKQADALVGAAILDRLDPLAFTHGLIGAAIAADIAAGERGRLHLRAAELLLARHAPPERVAAHLLAAPPTGIREHVAVLTGAAERALDAGVPASAIAYLRRALEEPSEQGERAELLLMLARAEVGTDPDSASTHLDEAQTLGLPGRQGAEVQLALGRALYVAGRHEEAARTFLAGSEGLDPADPLARELQAWFVSPSIFVESLRPRGLELAEQLAVDPPAHLTAAERAVLAQVAAQRVILGAPLREVRALGDRAWGGGEMLREETCDGYSWMHVTAIYLWGGDYATTLQIVEAVLEDARARGSVMAFATASYIKASAELWQGRLLDALAEIEQTLDVHRRDGWSMLLGAAQYIHADARLERGELDEAEAALELADEPRYATSSEGAALLMVRARVLLARARPADALEVCRVVQERMARTGINPPRLFPVWDVMADALARMEDPQQALAVLDRGETIVRRAELPDILARLLVARARLQDAESALATLREAVVAAEGSQNRLELARAQLALGTRLRRAGRRTDAVEALRPALDLAHRAGASPLETLAREELAVLGARPRRTVQSGAEALTASELRTARLAADGLTNREIAEALFVTPKTVEYHLRNTFMKLDVASRRELAGALGAAGAGG